MKILLVLILLAVVSCNNNIEPSKEEKSTDKNIKEKIDAYINEKNKKILLEKLEAEIDFFVKRDRGVYK